MRKTSDNFNRKRGPTNKATLENCLPGRQGFDRIGFSGDIVI